MVHEVTKGRTRLSDVTFTFHFICSLFLFLFFFLLSCAPNSLPREALISNLAWQMQNVRASHLLKVTPSRYQSSPGLPQSVPFLLPAGSLLAAPLWPPLQGRPFPPGSRGSPGSRDPVALSVVPPHL